MKKYSPFFLLLLLLSCSSKKISNPKPEFNKGEVLEKVLCTRDTSQTYALYVPTRYTPEKKWPVIYFFDPHANGKLPVQLYKVWAEKYGYILAGSNYSQNGMPADVLNRHVNTFRDDVFQKISIDVQRVYTAGFSGGAKVASSVALFDGGVNGVIACGAGFPELHEPAVRRFHFIGFAGDKDFNLTPMKLLEDELERSGFRHQLIVFDGKHDWPPQEYMQHAFWWLQVNEMKDGLIPRDDVVVSEIIQTIEKLIAASENRGSQFEIYAACRELINFLTGLTDVSHYKIKFDDLARSEGIREILQDKIHIQKIEAEKQQNYARAFAVRDAAWWMSEVKQLHLAAKNNVNSEQRLMDERLINFLSLLAYSNSTIALNSGQTGEAQKFLQIYALVDPANPEHRYLFACLRMKQNRPDQALPALREAINLGFNDLKRLENDETLAPLRERNEYQEAVRKMRRTR